MEEFFWWIYEDTAEFDITYYNFAVRSSKKSPNQETGLGNMGRLTVLNDTKLVLNEHE